MNQVEWEKRAVRKGADSYWSRQLAARNSTTQQSDTEKALLQSGIEEVASFLRAKASAPVGKHSNINKHFRQVAEVLGYELIAYKALNSVISSVVSKDHMTLQAVINDCAKEIELELQYIRVKALEPDLIFAIEQERKRDHFKRGEAYSLRQRLKKIDSEWNAWSTETTSHFGARMVAGVKHVYSDFFGFVPRRRGKTVRQYIEATPEFEDWIASFTEQRSLMRATAVPTIEPPLDWIGCIGGFHTYPMRKRVPFVKTMREGDDLFEKFEPLKHQEAMNKLQQVEWQINTFTYDVMQEIRREETEHPFDPDFLRKKPIEGPEYPEQLKDIKKPDRTDKQEEAYREWATLARAAHTAEHARKSKFFRRARMFNLAEELVQRDKFWFVYFADFRGRLYAASPDLSPQGDDYAKSLLKFHKGKPLGATGGKWLGIHLANTFGVDKVDHEDRIKWATDRLDMIHDIVADPLSNSYWLDADKPYQFLAACEEWSKSQGGTDETFISHLPIGLDGSCNGIQHFSALLRDKIGGRATNLIDANIPADLYGTVAEVVVAKLEYKDTTVTRRLLQIGINRKTTKRQVMTLPYGSTLTSCMEYTAQWLYEVGADTGLSNKQMWEMVTLLSRLIWDSIEEVVVAARAAMDYLKKGSIDEHITWVTPIGFPIKQPYTKVPTVRLKTAFGRIQFHKYREAGDCPPSKAKQRLGIAPNFVHSLDATHLVMTTLAVGDIDLAMIHDDYGTHAADTQELYSVIREQFIELYTESDPLEEWAKQVGKSLDDLPERGNLDIEDVRSSRYFFT